DQRNLIFFYCPLDGEQFITCNSPFFVSLTSSAPKTAQPLEQGQTQKFLLFPQTEAEATA
ncbi:hypothetical protein, partial [Selenomonas ruminantium]|uniref:hypothetical protein n=1 Tax=Selenomonas ruminantium TaxID=971 RepID=UPI0026E980A9